MLESARSTLERAFVASKKVEPGPGPGEGMAHRGFATPLPLAFPGFDDGQAPQGE